VPIEKMKRREGMKRKIAMMERRRESKVGHGNQSYALLLGSPV